MGKGYNAWAIGLCLGSLPLRQSYRYGSRATTRQDRKFGMKNLASILRHEGDKISMISSGIFFPSLDSLLLEHDVANMQS